MCIHVFLVWSVFPTAFIVPHHLLVCRQSHTDSPAPLDSILTWRNAHRDWTRATRLEVQCSTDWATPSCILKIYIALKFFGQFIKNLEIKSIWIFYISLLPLILKINENATLVFSISFQHRLVHQNFVFIRQLYFTYSIKRSFYVLTDCQYA